MSADEYVKMINDIGALCAVATWGKPTDTNRQTEALALTVTRLLIYPSAGKCKHFMKRLDNSYCMCYSVILG